MLNLINQEEKVLEEEKQGSPRPINKFLALINIQMRKLINYNCLTLINNPKKYKVVMIWSFLKKTQKIIKM